MNENNVLAKNDGYNGEFRGLAQIAGTNAESLQTVANNLKTYIKAEDENALQVVTDEVNRRPGLFGMIFPGKILKENETLTIQRMKDMFKNRQDMMKPWLDLQIALTKNAGEMLIQSKVQQYNKELSVQAMQIRTDLTAFSQRKIDEMSDTFEKSRSQFGERMSRQFAEAEKHKDNEFLYKRLKQNLEKETDMFFETIEELLSGFKEALKNKLNQN